MVDGFCATCGRPSRPHDRFCRACGAALTDEAAAASPVHEAESLVIRGQLSDAIATLQRAIGRSDAAELHVALATLHLRGNAMAEAEHELSAAIALDATCAVAHAYSGALLVQRGLVAEAQEALDTARALAPDDLVVARKRAEFFLALGILERARDELMHGLADGGGSQELRTSAAQLLAEIERRLSRSVKRHPVKLPGTALVTRFIGRRGRTPN